MNDKELREKAASALLGLEQQNKELQVKLASADRRDHCVKIARKMVERGMLRDNVEDFFDKVAELEEHENLDGIEAAVDLAVQGFSLGEVDDAEKNATESDSSMEALIRREMDAQGL